jgi:hypothetical protein
MPFEGRGFDLFRGVSFLGDGMLHALFPDGDGMAETIAIEEAEVDGCVATAASCEGGAAVVDRATTSAFCKGASSKGGGKVDDCAGTSQSPKGDGRVDNSLPTEPSGKGGRRLNA